MQFWIIRLFITIFDIITNYMPLSGINISLTDASTA